MENNQNTIGMAEANNSSSQLPRNNQISATDSFRQSLYIVAISRSLGCEGLVSAVTDTRKDGVYTFDFYHPRTQVFFKVMRDFDERRYVRYATHPAQPLIILEADRIPHQIQKYSCGCEYMEITDTKIATAIRRSENTLIYHLGELWDGDVDMEGQWTWMPLIPAALQPCTCEDDESDTERSQG